MMKLRKTILMAVAMTACLVVGTSLAEADSKDPQVQIYLSKIDKVTSSESRGDELYFSVTEYSSIERPRHYLVPNFPTHWLSQHLAEIKDVVLWEKPLANDESVMVLISLLERDAPPWNVDDLIGTVKLQVHNVDGNIKKEWTVPNVKDTKEVDAKENIFVLSGEQSEYNIDLKVVE